MIMHLVSPSKFRSALVIGKSEALIKVDKDFLKRVDIREVRTAVSAADAKRIMSRFAAEIVICADELADMTGLDFVRSLRADDGYRDVPVVMVSTSPGREAVLQSVAAGCAGYLVRPYSLDALSRHMDAAWRLREFAGERTGLLRRAGLAAESGEMAKAVGDYEAVVSAGDPMAYFEDGAGHFENGRFDQAIEAFNKAVKLNELFAEAYLGLSRSYAAKGLVNQARKYFGKAAHASLVDRRFAQLKEQFVALYRAEADGFNPFAAMGREMSKLRDLAGAEEAFGCALELAPKDSSLHVELARVYHAQRRSEEALTALGAALTLRGDDHAAQELYQRLTGRGYDEIGEPFEDPDSPFRPSLTMRIINAVLYMAVGATEAIHRLRRPDMTQAA
ncbi:MAG: tetratricopeptide repeat protein [Desulfovibrionaceae bacterium]|nr:tetratricopeptide repeat protein [Desulfovibrionaceae bacterium]MBF0512969.1 tetratricopeptide repeat protein [Desulfovibrionaceae bacterium]